MVGRYVMLKPEKINTSVSGLNLCQLTNYCQLRIYSQFTGDKIFVGAQI